MKKTLIINIGNTIIHFEEDAYEALTSYLNEVKAHFSSTADNLEIVTDIENRIAEMLNELLASQDKKVVELIDAREVMTRMGSISDFEQEDEKPSGAQFEAYKGYKRLFRDPEDTLIAGVCSGLAHYLNMETKWIRILFFVFIFLGGSSILAYIILWIVVPPALSRAEKMAMRGEASNLQGFKRNFDEELAAFKERMKHANAQFEPYSRRTGSVISEFVAVFGRFLGSALKVFFKIIALFIIVMGIGFMLMLIVSLAAILGFWDNSVFSYFPLSIINNGYQDALLFAAFVTCFVPLLALVLFSIRVAFNRNTINRTLSFALLTIWLCGVSFTAYYISKITTEFKEYAEITESSEIAVRPAYVLNLDERMFFNEADSVQYDIDMKSLRGRVIHNDDSDHPFRWPRNVRIEIEKSENERASLSRFYSSNGRTFKTALQNAQNINYTFVQKDSLLTFSPRLYLKAPANWRSQEVKLVLRIPVGTKLRIKDDMYRYVNHYYWNCSEDNTEYSEWIMTDEGIKCANEKPEDDRD